MSLCFFSLIGLLFFCKIQKITIIPYYICKKYLSLAENRNRGMMLRGVVSTSVMKNPVLTKTEKQQAYVKDSLTRAMQ